ncbi:hypothetical protein EGJ77_17220, partial [Stenotrophomonas maltophilia]
LTWTYLQRPPPPDPPRHTPGNQLSTLLLPLPLLLPLRVQGAALPEPQHPVLATVIIPVHTSLPI